VSSVLVTVDSLRPDHLGQYGYARDTFPALDVLLDNGGTLYTNAFANGTHSAESIPSFLRSRYQPSLDDDEPSLAGVLENAGIPTAAIHSNTVYDELVGAETGDFSTYQYLTGGDSVRSDPPLRKRLFRGMMDLIRPTVERLGIRKQAERVQQAIFSSELIHTQSEYTRASTITEEAIRWIDSVDGEFFLWVHYMDPHRPYGVSEDEFAYGELPDHEESHRLMSKAGLRPKTVTDADIDRMRDWYDSDIRYTSHHVRTLFDHLLSEVDEDVSVVFTADHGDEFGEHGAFFHRNRPYDELIHVPLVSLNLGNDEDVVTEQRELVDVAPSVCERHGIEPSSRFQGTPLTHTDPRRVLATGSFLNGVPVRAGRWDGWKYIQSSEEEFYDLANDGAESNNLFESRWDDAERYRDQVTRRLEEREELSVGGEDVDEETKERLAQLGYLDDDVVE
jgi:arylsulfatase A-like enzyme